MSLKFCRVVKELLEASEPIMAKIPGGIYPDELSKIADDIRNEPAAVYWVENSTPIKSAFRHTGASNVTMAFRIETNDVDELSAVCALVSKRIADYSKYTSTEDGEVVGALSFSIGQTRSIMVPDASNESVRQADFLITGIGPTF
jgi:hypothetical protein